MTLVVDENQKKSGPPLLLQVAALVVATALAIIMGWYTGTYLEGQQNPPSASETVESSSPEQVSPEQETARATLPLNVMPLDPITTNLADPEETWVRLELALVFEGEPDPLISKMIHQDLFAYMRTVRLRQVESASGFQHLKADLLERARIRSEGRVNDILFLTFLYE